MPFSGPGDPALPKNVKALPEAKRRQWVRIFNDVLKRCDADAKTCEARAFRQANGVIKRMTANFFQLSANQTGLARRETHNGKEWLIAPFVAAVQGVMNGELYPAEELAKFPESWNGRPVVIRHPLHRGAPISANSPHILADSPGQIFNAKFVNNKLTWDVWLDVAKVEALNGDALRTMKRIEAGELVESSTGLFRDLEAASGVHNGKPFNGIVHNIRPDHFALLPDTPGACSIADGCGGPRINQDVSESVSIAFFLKGEEASALSLPADSLPDGSEPMELNQMHLTLAYLGQVADMPQGEDVLAARLADFASFAPIIRGEVGGIAQFSVDGSDGMKPVVALIDSSTLHNFRQNLVDHLGPGFMPNRTHAFTPHVTLAHIPAGEMPALALPERREIVFDSLALAWGNRVTVFRLQGENMEINEQSNGAAKPQINSIRAAWHVIMQALGIKESDMTKAQLVEKLVANERCKFKKETLEAWDEAALQTLEKSLAEPTPETPATPPAQETPAEPPATPPPADAPAWAAQLLQEMGTLKQEMAGIKGTIQANENQERAQLVTEIVANSAMTADDLKPVTDLGLLRKLAQQVRPAFYGGRGLPSPQINDGGDWEDYEVPEVPAANHRNGGGK